MFLLVIPLYIYIHITLIKVSARGKASWGGPKGCIGFTCNLCNLLRTVVKHSIEKYFFTVEKIMLRKYVGITTVIDLAPFCANLFLYFYEN